VEQTLIGNKTKQAVAERYQGTRPYQEDDYGLYQQQDSLLILLCDGMGGAKGGALASQTVVQHFMQYFSDFEQEKLPERLQNALKKAHQQLQAQVKQDPDLGGMGCTLVAGWIEKNQLHWISVGDSPLWCYRQGKLIRLNQDHSMRSVLAEQVSQGKISAEEANVHPDRNGLLSAVSNDPIEEIDLNHCPLQPNDWLIFASDGLFSLSDQQISQQCESHTDAESLVNALIQQVKDEQKTSQDNTTVIGYRVAQQPTIATPISPPKKPFQWKALLLATILFGLGILSTLAYLQFSTETPVEVIKTPLLEITPIAEASTAIIVIPTASTPP
jgi:PPM family protein phosphatase